MQRVEPIMKDAENTTKTFLDEGSYHVLRVDGSNFRSYTKGLVAPFDEQLAADMDAVTRELCAEVTGTLVGFTQSDEISLVFSDLQSETTQTYRGGAVPKINSIVAALATAAFNDLRPGKRALFDCRTFSLPSAEMVTEYLKWRQSNGAHNAVSMAGRAHFSHRELEGVSSWEVKQLLERERGIIWDDYPDGFRLGRVTSKVSTPGVVTFTDGRTNEKQTIEVMRSSWKSAPAELFASPTTEQPGIFLPY